MNLETNLTYLFRGLRKINFDHYDYVWVRSPGLRVWMVAIMLFNSKAKVVLELPSPLQTLYTPRIFIESTSKSKFIAESIFLFFCLPIFRKSFFRVIQYGNESFVIGFIIGAEKFVQVPNPSLISSTAAVQYLCEPKLSNGEKFPRLVFVGALEFWHGIDRVLWGIVNAKKKIPNLEIEFLVIGGLSPAQQIFIKEILGKWYEEVLRDVGPLSLDQVSECLIGCSVGIGSLGFHRINLKLASPLKDGLYARCGIPFVASYDDPRFSTKQAGRLQVEGSDKYLDLMQVWHWYRDLDLKECNRSLYLTSKNNYYFEEPIRQSVFGN